MMNFKLATNLLVLSVFVSLFQGISSTTGIFSSSNVETAVTMGDSSRNVNVQTTSVVAEGTISPDVPTPAPSTETQTTTMQQSTSRTVVPDTTGSSSAQGSNPSFETIVVMETTTIAAADTTVNGATIDATTSPAVVSSNSAVMSSSSTVMDNSGVVSGSAVVGNSSAVVNSIKTTSGAIPPTVLPSSLSGSITTNNLTEAFTESRCLCDLHVTSCDINCCCDQDCLTAELQVFTSCRDIPPQSNNPVCVAADHFIQSQTTFRTELVTQGSSDLLCIFFDNYPGRTEFGPPPDVSSTDINTVLRLYGRPGDTLNARILFSYGPFYRYRDPIQSVYNNSVLGMWTLPVAQNSVYCNRGSAVEYLVDQSSSCQISVSDMSTICNAMSSISLETYTTNYGVLRLPSEVLNTSMVVPINLGNVVCRTSGGVVRGCGQGSLIPEISEDSCRNALRELSFVVEHQGSSGIMTVSVDAVLQDVPLMTTGPLLQQFAVRYMLFNRTLSSDDDINLKRSGVGGYQNGLPLLAGKLVEQEEIPSFINISVNPSEWFTVGSSEQYCVDTPTMSVNFLQEVETNCFLLTSAHTSCSNLQDTAYGILSPWNASVSHVGRVGDANPNNLSEWVEIRNSRGPSTMQIESQCSSIPVGVSILILYTRTGSASLPSSQVFGVHTVYQTETVCLGSGCGPIPKPIPMHMRISYVDLTQGPAEVLKSITDIQGQLPEDFFYPFFVASNSHSTVTHNIFTSNIRNHHREESHISMKLYSTATYMAEPEPDKQWLQEPTEPRELLFQTFQITSSY